MEEFGPEESTYTFRPKVRKDEQEGKRNEEATLQGHTAPLTKRTALDELQREASLRLLGVKCAASITWTP